jgi:hypothetical protein
MAADDGFTDHTPVFGGTHAEIRESMKRATPPLPTPAEISAAAINQRAREQSPASRKSAPKVHRLGP